MHCELHANMLHHAQRHESPILIEVQDKFMILTLVGAIISSSSPFLNGRP